MQDTAGIFLISCNRNRFFSDMMDVSMLIQNAKEGCGLDEKELLRQLQEQRAGALGLIAGVEQRLYHRDGHNDLLFSYLS